MARNGTEMGVQVAGPARAAGSRRPPRFVQDALLREGHREEDAARDIGDSAVIECIGLGGMAIAAAPAVATFFGGTAADAAARTRLMGEICAARSTRFSIPGLDFAPGPVGIDARLVVELDTTPQISTGVLHGSSGGGADRRGRRASAGRAVPRGARGPGGGAGRPAGTGSSRIGTRPA